MAVAPLRYQPICFNMVTATNPIVGCITVSRVTILKHTNGSDNRNPLLRIAQSSNVLQYGGGAELRFC